MALHDLRYRLEIATGWVTARLLRLFLAEKPLPVEELRRRQPRRILLVRPNRRLGNTLLTTPAIDIFRRAFPDAQVDYLTAGGGGQLLRNLPLGEVLVFRREHYLNLWKLFSFVKEVRRRRYDVAVDCGFGSRTDALLVALSGARLKVGMENPLNGFLYNIRAPLPPRELHKEEKWEHVARALGLGYAGERMRLVLDEGEKAWARAWLEAQGLPAASRVGVFVGGRGRKGKRWPLERFLELVRMLQGQGRQVLVFIGPEERGAEDRLSVALHRAPALPGAARLVLEPSVRKAAALIGLCALFISCDSGPMHLACALQVPVLAIFLKDNWRRWGPRPDRGRVLRGGSGLSAEEVARTAREMLESRPPRPALPA